MAAESKPPATSGTSDKAFVDSNVLIIGARQTYVLDANDIEFRKATTKTANDVGVEVLVR